MKLVRRVIGRIQVKDLEARIIPGLDDPADTGMLYGMIWPFFGLLPSRIRDHVSVEPSFNKQTAEIEGHGLIRVYPITLVWPLSAFVFSPPAVCAVKRLAFH